MNVANYNISYYFSLIQFFNKIKNWMEMAAMSTDFKDRISRLERKFAVSTVLFRKFKPIFQEIFTGLTDEPIKQTTKSKKHKWVSMFCFLLPSFQWIHLFYIENQNFFSLLYWKVIHYDSVVKIKYDFCYIVYYKTLLIIANTFKTFMPCL